MRITQRTPEQQERVDQIRAMRRETTMDLRQIGQLYGISGERVRQLCRGIPFQRKLREKKSRYIPVRNRFWERVDFHNPEGCWIWEGALTACGYGNLIGPEKKKIYAHVFAYKLQYGEIPEGLWILHKCDNPRCVNPDHLYAGTPKDNTHDKETRNRGNHGKRLTRDTVMAIKQTLEENPNQSAAARKFGVSQPIIHRIAHGKAYAHVDVWNPETDTHTPAIMVEGNPPAVIPSPSSPSV